MLLKQMTIKNLIKLSRYFHTYSNRKTDLVMQAVASRNYDVITYLLNKGIDANLMDRDGWTAKAWAVLLNDSESMKRLRGLSVLSHSSGLAIVAIGSGGHTV